MASPIDPSCRAFTRLKVIFARVSTPPARSILSVHREAATCGMQLTMISSLLLSLL